MSEYSETDRSSTFSGTDTDYSSFSESDEVNENDINETKRKYDFWDFKKIPFRGSLKNYKLGKQIAKGKFGDIKLATFIKTSKVYVMKRLVKSKLISKTGMALQAKNEVELQYQLRKSPDIVQIVDFFTDVDAIYIVLEYCSGGNLFDKRELRPNHTFSDRQAAIYVYQIVRALAYCHERGVIHRDLKLENVLISVGGSLKLADFGWATQLKSLKDRRKTICGTLDYFSPEMLNSETYQFTTDIWSLGVLAYELLVGDVPFPGASKEEIYGKISEYDYTIPSTVSRKARDFIESCLQYPENRPSIGQLLKHPWLHFLK